MSDKDFVKRLTNLGLPLFDVTEEINVNETLAQAVFSKDPRLLEGFPLMLLNAQKKFGWDKDEVKGFLNMEDKAFLDDLLLLSLGAYEAKGLRFAWAGKLLKGLSSQEKKTVSVYKERFLKDQEILFHQKKLRTHNILGFLDEYKEIEALKAKKQVAQYQELSMENALSQIFSPKQKELFFKKVAGEKLTKTENEYYSRRVKKKVSALANVEIHSLAKMLMG